MVTPEAIRRLIPILRRLQTHMQDLAELERIRSIPGQVEFFDSINAEQIRLDLESLWTIINPSRNSFPESTPRSVANAITSLANDLPPPRPWPVQGVDLGEVRSFAKGPRAAIVGFALRVLERDCPPASAGRGSAIGAGRAFLDSMANDPEGSAALERKFKAEADDFVKRQGPEIMAGIEDVLGLLEAPSNFDPFEALEGEPPSEPRDELAEARTPEAPAHPPSPTAREPRGRRPFEPLDDETKKLYQRITRAHKRYRGRREGKLAQIAEKFGIDKAEVRRALAREYANDRRKGRRR